MVLIIHTDTEGTHIMLRCFEHDFSQTFPSGTTLSEIVAAHTH